MVVLDAMEKCAGVRVLETELNDSPGVCMKLYGRLGDIRIRRARRRGNRRRHADPDPSCTSSPALRSFRPPPTRPRRTSAPSSSRQPSKYRRTI